MSDERFRIAAEVSNDVVDVSENMRRLNTVQNGAKVIQQGRLYFKIASLDTTGNLIPKNMYFSLDTSAFGQF